MAISQRLEILNSFFEYDEAMEQYHEAGSPSLVGPFGEQLSFIVDSRILQERGRVVPSDRHGDTVTIHLANDDGVQIITDIDIAQDLFYCY